MKTFMARNETVERNWYLMNAEGIALGRLAATIATILKGKHLPTYTPHIDAGGAVVVVNARKVLLTGRKMEQKIYRRHSGYFGHMKEIRIAEVMERFPERIIETAVRRMMPRTPLGRAMMRKLKVYAGPEHPHEAQKPVAWDGGFGRGMKKTVN